MAAEQLSSVVVFVAVGDDVIKMRWAARFAPRRCTVGRRLIFVKRVVREKNVLTSVSTESILRIIFGKETKTIYNTNK